MVRRQKVSQTLQWGRGKEASIHGEAFPSSISPSRFLLFNKDNLEIPLKSWDFTKFIGEAA